MRSIRIAFASSLTLAVGAFAADTPKIEYHSPAAVAAARAKGETGSVIITDPAFRVMASRRDKPGLAEIHAHETDLFVVIEGAATIVIGGEIVEPRTTEPGETRGTSIRGGKDYALEPGVVLTVPHNTPHWVRDVKPGFRYYVIKTPTSR
jgi:mannose-6-phosphate isomerase-like protein (cupin superfamily)